MEHTQTMRKRRQDKTLLEGKRCKHYKKPSYDTKEKYDKTHQAKEKLQENKNPKFYKGQNILWHQRMNKLGPGKFRIRWSGPYEIKEIYNNNTIDVITLQGESLGRVNMSKIKPYHEPWEANTYVLETPQNYHENKMELAQTNAHFKTTTTTMKTQLIRTTKESYANSTRNKE